MLPRPSSFRYMVVGLLVLALAGQLRAAVPDVTPATPMLTIENLGKGMVKLDGPWQFHLGDNPDWAMPDVEDRAGQNGWEQLTAAAPWGTQGHPSYTGYAWYRKHITISAAPGVSPNIALCIPTIDDVYELYWNGKPVGRFGSFPPRLVPYLDAFPQTFGLGSISSGVLAVRVYKAPLSSVDDGKAGGFESVPSIGSPQAIALLRESANFRWLQHSQFRFGLTSLYVLVSILSFIFWLRDKRLNLLFWVSIYTFMPLLETVFNGMHLHVSGIWLQFIIQPSIQLRELSQWFLLVYLLQLEELPALMRRLKILAWMSMLAGTLDGGLGFVMASVNVHTYTMADAILTAFILPVEAVPIVLILIALLKRRRLDSGRWLVAVLAFVSATWYSVSNFAYQGIRYTHWTLAVKMGEPLFTLFGSYFPMQTVLRTLLFLSIVYAVVHSASDYRRKQGLLEQEFKSARELQQILIPEALPELPGFAFSSAYRPAQEVGGDFFQVIPLEGEWAGSTLVILGDVSGKGLKAAMTVALIVGVLRTVARFTAQPAKILSELNSRLFGRLQDGFATCLAMRLSADGQWVIANAGHPAPYLNKRELDTLGALPLGVAANTVYEERQIQLQEGDHIALYTDGLLEARGPNGEIFSFERLDSLMASQPDAKRAADTAVDFGQDDDITVLTLTRLAAGEASSTRFSAPHLAQI